MSTPAPDAAAAASSVHDIPFGNDVTRPLIQFLKKNIPAGQHGRCEDILLMRRRAQALTRFYSTSASDDRSEQIAGLVGSVSGTCTDQIQVNRTVLNNARADGSVLLIQNFAYAGIEWIRPMFDAYRSFVLKENPKIQDVFVLVRPDCQADVIELLTTQMGFAQPKLIPVDDEGKETTNCEIAGGWYTCWTMWAGVEQEDAKAATPAMGTISF